MNSLIKNKVIRYSALLLLAESIFSFPLQYILLGLVALVVYLSEEQDLQLVDDVKAAVAKLDVAKVKGMVASLKKDTVEVVEEVEALVETEPVVLPVEAPTQEVSSSSKSKGFGKS